MLARLAPCVLVVGLVACGGTHHRSMHDAALGMVCGSNCGGVDVELQNTRRADSYATAFVRTRPPGKFQDATFLFRQQGGDWKAVDAWTDLAGLDCPALAHQMATPERVLIKLGVCP